MKQRIKETMRAVRFEFELNPFGTTCKYVGAFVIGKWLGEVTGWAINKKT